MRPRLAILPAILLALAACAAPDGDTPVDASSAPSDHADGSADPGDSGNEVPADADGVLIVQQGAVADGPGISVTDALGWMGEGEAVLVNGALFVDAEGDIRLCEALAESFPPQCGGARLLVEGIGDLDAFPELQEEGDVRWVESVQLFGTVEPPDAR